MDGNPVATTPVMTLGDAVRSRLGYTAPERSWQYSENGLVAGEYHAVGMDMQGISPAQLETLKTDLDTVKGQLEAENTTGLTKHDLVGNILQTGIQGYLAMTYAMDKMAANPSNVVSYRAPSYGTFGTHARVAYAFGLPSEYIFSGLVMDVDQIQSNNESKDNCYEDWLAFNQASGTRSSAFEHQVPEMMFSTEENSAEAVSTVKALAIAMAQGQRIYTLTQDNAGELSNITIDDTARAEIQSAVSQGLTVTVHQVPINVNDWEGSGYAIVDADYGVGAYKISGGSSGSHIYIQSLNLLAVVGLASLLPLGIVSGFIVLIGALLAGVMLGSIDYAMIGKDFSENALFVAKYAFVLAGILTALATPALWPVLVLMVIMRLVALILS